MPHKVTLMGGPLDGLSLPPGEWPNLIYAAVQQLPCGTAYPLALLSKAEPTHELTLHVYLRGGERSKLRHVARLLPGSLVPISAERSQT